MCLYVFIRPTLSLRRGIEAESRSGLKGTFGFSSETATAAMLWSVDDAVTVLEMSFFSEVVVAVGAVWGMEEAEVLFGAGTGAGTAAAETGSVDDSSWLLMAILILQSVATIRAEESTWVEKGVPMLSVKNNVKLKGKK